MTCGLNLRLDGKVRIVEETVDNKLKLSGRERGVFDDRIDGKKEMFDTRFVMNAGNEEFDQSVELLWLELKRLNR